jgi:branched-chain amino acid transport system permease protein
LGDVSLVLNLALICTLAVLALSMSFLWGYAGILSFGQTLYFGLGGYAFAIIAMNYEISLSAFFLALIIPVLMGAILGYFMIYGRISDIYLSVMTLVMTLIFEKAIRATSGPEYVIGSVRLNGQNGIPNVPGLQLPWQEEALGIDGIFYLSAILMVLVYIGLRALLGSSFGRILVGIRENETRMQLLGYDTRRYKLMAFVLCAAIAGLAGVLLALWGNFVSPEMFSLSQAAQVVIWVIVGGRSTLVGPILGVAFTQSLQTWLGTNGVGQVSLIQGFILIMVVLALPSGLLPSLVSLARKSFSLLTGKRPPAADPASGDGGTP